MKFANSNALLAVGAFGAAANARVMSREASVIEGLLQSVFQSMANADNHVLQFQASGDVSALKQSGEDLISVIAAGVEKAQAMEPLQEEDVAAISPISQQLSAIGAKFLKDMGEAAPKFAAGGYCSHANQFVGHLCKLPHHVYSPKRMIAPV
ncbi:hypothetical protein NPX13_g11137 [Xylaria arbuscula]|uniref:Uncharacterized protein n=1 Tax=Xylaria arbuscula TaxID=114810 RepID=A0A9W8TFW7_9PEZI|nr:hypothetical protein NPX13_g11137 [Xylaria arbuscula]